MNLQIRDPRARQLALELARKRHVSMTEAVIDALEAELKRESERTPLASRLAELAGALQQQAGSHGREMSRDEIDRMWGHP